MLKALLLLSALLMQSGTSWLGKYSCMEEFTQYTLAVKDKYKGMNMATLTCEGIQEYYKIDVRGLEKDNKMEFYYWGVEDGHFMAEEKINREKPLFTLINNNGKLTTEWQQRDWEGKGRKDSCFQRK